MELTEMEKEELEKAVHELEEVTAPPPQEKVEITTRERLSKAIEGLTGFFKKSTTTKETPADDKTAAQGETALVKGQTDTAKEEDKVVDVTALLDSLNTGLLKSLSTVDGRVDDLSKAVGLIGRGLLAVCETQKQMYDMLAATPKSVPMGGVITNGKGREDGTEEVKKSGVSMAAIRKSLTAAANANEIDPQLLGMFHTQPQHVLELVPENVAKSYGIPRTLQ